MSKIVSLKMSDGATWSKIVPNPDKLSKCPECGQSLNLFTTETTDDEWAFEYHVKVAVKFCPNCGREMMKRERKTKLTSMDKSEQCNDETQTREGFSKLTKDVKQ